MDRLACADSVAGIVEQRANWCVGALPISTAMIGLEVVAGHYHVAYEGQDIARGFEYGQFSTLDVHLE